MVSCDTLDFNFFFLDEITFFSDITDFLSNLMLLAGVCLLLRIVAGVFLADFLEGSSVVTDFLAAILLAVMDRVLRGDIFFFLGVGVDTTF